MSTGLRMKIKGKERNVRPRKKPKKPKKEKDPFKKSIPRRMAEHVDFYKYKVNKKINPWVLTGLAIGGGLKGYEHYASKVPQINESLVDLLNKGIDKIPYLQDKLDLTAGDAGEVALYGLGVVALYEGLNTIIRGTQKSWIPLVNKIKADGIWKYSKRKNDELFEKDKRNRVGRKRKTLSYVKDLGIAGLVSLMLVPGFYKNQAVNIKSKIDAHFKDPEPAKEIMVSNLTEEQNKSLDYFVKKEDNKRRVGAFVYKMTNSVGEVYDVWNRKQGVKRHSETIEKYAKKYKPLPSLDESIRYIEGVMFTESGGDDDAVSKAGAIGAMQLMPDTAKKLGVDPNDPDDNVKGGVKLLKQLVEQYGDPMVALNYYNCNNDAVTAVRNRTGSDDPFVYGELLVKEAREYPIKVAAGMAIMAEDTPLESMLASVRVPAGGFKYVGDNPNGDKVYSYQVKSKDNATQIARKFNSWKGSQPQKYDSAQATDVVHENGRYVGHNVKTGQIVHVLATPYQSASGGGVGISSSNQ